MLKFKRSRTAYLRSCVGGILLFVPAVGSSQSVKQTASSGAPGNPPASSLAGKPTGSSIALSRSISLYRAHCLECHDTDGRGGSGRETMDRIPDFTNLKWHAARADQELAHAIREGKGLMPAMKTRLPSSEVEPMVRLVRSFRDGGLLVPEEGSDPESSAPATKDLHGQVGTRGQRSPDSSSIERLSRTSHASDVLYNRLCASCHGTDGRGSSVRSLMRSIPDFTSAAWHERQSDVQLITGILEGKGTEMPPFYGKLTDTQANELVRHIRSFTGLRVRAAVDPIRGFRRAFREVDGSSWPNSKGSTMPCLMAVP